MGETILLTAEPRTGKSTAIKKIIKLIGKENCGGFYTEEVRENGDRIGFNCVTLDGEVCRIADLSFDSDIRVQSKTNPELSYGVSIENFENIALESVRQALIDKDVIVIDEIGPIQLYSKKFQELILEVVSSSKVLLGTIFYNSHPEVDRYKNINGVNIRLLTLENRDIMTEDIASNLKNSIKID